MNIQQFQYILAVDELKNFGKAANKCFITQSTLSTMIVRFEEEIGITIFDRKRKPVALTQEGREIIQQLQVITREIRNLDEVVRNLKGELNSELKLGIIPTIAPYLLPRFLGPLSRKLKQVKFEVSEVTTATIIKGLKNRSLDIGLVSIPLKDKDLIEIPLYNEPFILYDNQRSAKPIQSFDEINFSRFWLLEEGHCLRTQVERICDYKKRQEKFVNNLEYKSGTIDSLMRFVRMNKGLTFLPYLATLEFSEEEKQKLSVLGNPAPARTVGLAIHKHFVKKGLLSALEEAVHKAVDPIFSDLKLESEIIDPI